jgi:hypothetical protein
MYGLNLGRIISVIVLIVLIAVIGVGIYQLNSDGNPWDFGGRDIPAGWGFLKED